MYFISTILFVDLIFITFWGSSTSLQSIIFNWITNPKAFDTNFVTLALTSLFTTLAIGATAAVVVSTISGAKTDTVLFAGFAAGTLFNVGKDFYAMYDVISITSTTLANLLILPFIIMFAFITIEWLRGKD